MLVMHDTTEFSFQRERMQPIGITHKVSNRRAKRGRPRNHTICGILMHSSLAVTPEGLPLGLTAIKFWNRKKFKGCDALKKKINPTRVPIEKKESIRWLENLRHATATLGDPVRCIHIGDRESDIYELFCAAQEIGTHFLVRTCVDRLAGDGGHTVAADMAKAKVRGQHRFEIQDANANPTMAVLEIKFEELQLQPPIGKKKQYPPLKLTVIHATERSKPKNRKQIIWKLITDLPVRSLKDAVEKLQWYALRWKIEVFHKILKSGCKAEDFEASHRGAAREPDIGLLHRELAHLLDDDAQPCRAKRAANPRTDEKRNPFARSLGTRQGRTTEPKGHLALSHQDSQARWLSRPRQRSRSGKYRHVARTIPSDRHRVGRLRGD